MTDPDDKQQIVDLTVRYCYALDERRFEDLRSVFTPDATADYASALCNGVGEIVDYVRSRIGHLDATQHLVANHQVAVNGDGATCSCYLHAQHVRAGTPGGELYMIAGRYDDTLARTADGWRITNRVLTRVWTEGNRDVVAPVPS